MAYSLLKTNGNVRSVAPSKAVITGTKKLEGFDGKRFILPATARSVSAAEEESVEIYELAIGDNTGEGTGFILASNDDRVGNFLAVAEGSLDDTDNPFVEILYDNLGDYIDATIDEYNAISDADIEAAIEKAVEMGLLGARTLSTHWDGIDDTWVATGSSHDFTIQKNALLNTQWGQGVPYSSYINKRINNSGYLTGCTTTAIAQIIAYHGYLKTTAPYKASSFSNASFNNANIGVWSGTYDWANLKNRVVPNTDALRGQTAALMWQVGSNVRANFYAAKGSTLTPIFDADQPLYTGFTNMGYRLDGYTTANKGMFEATRLSETDYDSSITYYKPLSYIKDALNANRPILVYGANYNGSGAHNWVIDGYGAMTWYREYVWNTQTGQTGYVTVTLNNCLIVHCNLGWNGSCDGWYVYGIFDTANRAWVGGNTSNSGGLDYSRAVKITVPIKNL
jgi:hypothetical protein